MRFQPVSVAVGLACLLAVAFLGGIFTLAFSGMSENDMLLNIAGLSAPIHAALGLGGWMTFTAMGVSYRLLTMFLLSPDDERRTTRLVWWAGGCCSHGSGCRRCGLCLRSGLGGCRAAGGPAAGCCKRCALCFRHARGLSPAQAQGHRAEQCGQHSRFCRHGARHPFGARLAMDGPERPDDRRARLSFSCSAG